MKLIVDELPAVVLNDLAERIVHGLLDDDGITRLAERLDAGGQSIDNAAAHRHRRRVHMVAVVREEPTIKGRIILRVRGCVAKDTMIDPLAKIRQNLLRQLEVHIRHPKGEQVVPSLALHPEVVLQAARPATVNHRVEVILPSHAQIPS